MSEEMWLDDSSYSRSYEKAMERLDAQAPWWTHREVSDPGIMLIEMWTLLADMQSYYLDQVQQSHYRKYLKLLGIAPDEGECAWTWVFFECKEDRDKEYIVPEGTKLLSDQMVFETVEEVRLRRNRLKWFYLGESEDRTSAMRLTRKNRFILEDDIRQERILFTFVLDKPLKPGEEFGFFVLLDERGKRNGAKEELRMVRLAWEYQSPDGWQEAEVVRDDTEGLLFSGIITLRIAPSSDEQKCAGSTIRCRLRQGTYDMMPVLYKIYLNVARVVQRDTLCCEEDLEFDGKCHRAALKSYLARTGRLRILKEVEEKDGGADGKLWEDITEDVRIDAPVDADRMERFVEYDGTGHVKVVCAAREVDPEDLTFRVTGIAAQRISLPWKKQMRSSVRLMIRQGDGEKRYRSCDRADPEENRYRNVWHWDGEEDVIVLGDGRHGEIPPPSEEGMCLTAVSLWEGKKGNVPVGRITKWQRPELFPGISCTNYLAARDGRSRREPSRQFEEVKETLLRQNRMVTEEDIRELALETPGLMINRAAAEWENNTVTVTISPTYPLKGSDIVEWYRRQVEKHLEPYRLAGTKLKVVIAGEKRRNWNKTTVSE
ncbi:MAG: hypothetical protein NC420_10870 [Eubacterium sp.]|nr:hypothetical protein [Eubacterium sp.]